MWDAARAPTTADDVCITVNGTYTVTGGTVTAQSLALGSGTGSAVSLDTTGVQLAADSLVESGATITVHGNGGTISDGGSLTSAGRLVFDSYYAYFSGTLVNRGTITAATLHFLNATDHFIQAAGTISGSSLVSVDGGVLTVSGGSIPATAQLESTSGQLEFPANSTATGRVIVFGKPLTSLSGDVPVGIDLVVGSSGNHSTSTLSIPNSLTNRGTITTAGYGDQSPTFAVADGAVLTNAGTVDVEPPAYPLQPVVIDGTFTNATQGTLTVNYPLTIAGTLTNEANATLTGGTYVLHAALQTPVGVTSNDADVTLGPGWSWTDATGADALSLTSNTDRLTVTRATYEAASGFTNYGQVGVVDGGTLAANDYRQLGEQAGTDVEGLDKASDRRSSLDAGPDGLNLSAGMLTGDGVITGTGGLLNAGRVLTHRIILRDGTPATLTVDGPYAQFGDGILGIQVTGSNTASLLSVGGPVSLDGALVVDLDGYQPSPGASYTALSSPTSVSGQFCSVQLSWPSPTEGVRATYPDTGGVEVHFVGIPQPVTGLAADRMPKSLRVTFTPPSDTGGWPLTGYDLTVTAPDATGSTAFVGADSVTDNGDGTVSLTVPTAGSPALADNTTYVVTVRADNGMFTSPAATVSQTTAGPPGEPGSLVATPGDQTVVVSFAGADSNGAPITSYMATAAPVVGGAPITATGAGSPLTITGLTNGTDYTVTVTATNAVGTGPASTVSDPVTPAAMPSPPTGIVAVAGDQSASVSWSAAADNGSAVTGYTATASPGGNTCSASGATGCTVTGLTNGISYTFTVTATNDVGVSPPSVPSTAVMPADTTRPTVTVTALPAFTLAPALAISYKGSDNHAVAGYDIRYRVAPVNAGFGRRIYPTGWQRTSLTRVSLNARRGSTYCFSVQARDTAGNVSGWSPERCTAVALDDRSLTASSGWVRGTGSRYYAGTVTRTTSAGKTLTRTDVQTRRLAIVATRCPGCGTVGVYWNGTLLKRISLNAATTQYKQVIPVATFTKVRSASVEIRTLRSGSTRIDGLALSRA